MSNIDFNPARASAVSRLSSTESARPAGELAGQNVRRGGFPWGTAGRILAAVVTVGLSELGIAIFKACINGQPSGRASAFVAQSPSLPRSRPDHVDPFVASRPADTLRLENEARLQAAIDNDGAAYDFMDRAEIARDDLADTWAKARKGFDREIAACEGREAVPIALPHSFANDLMRGEATLRDGKLLVQIGELKKSDLTDVQQHDAKAARVGKVEDFVDQALAGVDDTKTAKDNFKTNLFSFTQQGSFGLHNERINNAEKADNIIYMKSVETIDFDFSVAGNEIIVEQSIDLVEVIGLRNDVTEIGPSFTPLPDYQSKIVFALPISELIKADFDPASVRVISADWSR